jgi:hypothetical protein
MGFFGVGEHGPTAIAQRMSEQLVARPRAVLVPLNGGWSFLVGLVEPTDKFHPRRHFRCPKIGSVNRHRNTRGCDELVHSPSIS